MTPLGFLMARTLRREAPLAAMSMPPDALLATFNGQHVALVGNARGLAGAQHGKAIDAASLIIRINRAPMPSPASHGTRTDALALATSIDAPTLAKINPRLTLWMSHKRKRLPWRIASAPGFYLHPLAEYRALAQTLGAPPTTGLMMIDLLARATARSVTLYGFDFFATQSLSGRRTAADVPHDFAAEAAFVTALLARDPRFTLRKHPA